MEKLSPEAFGEIYEQHFSRVYNYISYRINHHWDTEDLVSGVFARVMEKYDLYDPEKAPMEAWIIGIAKHAVTDYFRGRSRHPALPLEDAQPYLSGGAEPEAIAVRDESNRQLMEALNRLQERERQIVAMKYGGELGNGAIARLMNLSESNVGVILFRSLEKMRKYMEREESEWEEIPGKTTGCRG